MQRQGFARFQISCIGYPFRKFPKRVLACAFCRIPALARVMNIFHTSKPSLTFTVALGQVFNDLAVEQLPAMANQKQQCWCDKPRRRSTNTTSCHRRTMYRCRAVSRESQHCHIKDMRQRCEQYASMTAKKQARRLYTDPAAKAQPAPTPAKQVASVTQEKTVNS